jgi:hypothetical protein
MFDFGFATNLFTAVLMAIGGYMRVSCATAHKL